jgi:hypothetical protein
MTSIDFGVTRSKVKVTGALNVKMVSADYLEKYLTLKHLCPGVLFVYRISFC